jgi:hypothetical protein
MSPRGMMISCGQLQGTVKNWENCQDDIIFHGLNVIIFDVLDVSIFLRVENVYIFYGVNIIIFKVFDVIIFELLDFKIFRSFFSVGNSNIFHFLKSLCYHF